jgi:hypothetical protein
VFTLVIAGILRDQFGVHVSLFGALIVYTLANTLVPGFALPPAAPPGPPVAGDATTPVTTDAPAEAS